MATTSSSAALRPERLSRQIWIRDQPTAAGPADPTASGHAAAQAALIISEEPKFHMGGMIAGPSLAPDERRITAKSGEAVLSAGTVQRLGGEQAINRMENGASGSPVVIVTNPFKHYDRFIKGRKMMGVDSQSTGRKGY